jgi:integrase
VSAPYASGSRTLIAQGRVNGKVRRVSIGRQGVFTVAWHPKRARTERIPFDRIGAVWRMLTRQVLEGSAAKGVRSAAGLIQFLILTGARWQESGLLKWDCVVLDGKAPSWHIPEHRSRTGGERTLPLASQAVDVLRAQPHCPHNPYVFTGRNGKGHVGHPAETCSKVSAVAGLHVSAHSMRRTFTNIALKLGIEMWKHSTNGLRDASSIGAGFGCSVGTVAPLFGTCSRRSHALIPAVVATRK